VAALLAGTVSVRVAAINSHDVALGILELNASSGVVHIRAQQTPT
jgi:hypothetical protein